MCLEQGHGRAAYEAVKAKTAHHHQCKSLWDILDKKRNSCSTYLEEVHTHESFYAQMHLVVEVETSAVSIFLGHSGGLDLSLAAETSSCACHW